jgi:glyoxylate/hydroxypyruvate reductase A
MSSILLAINGWDPSGWEQRFRALAPQHEIRIWPEQAGDPADVTYACAWNAPPGLFSRYRNLKAIFSLGAGVDNLLSDPDLPDVPIVRVVDNDLTMRMTEYVMLHVLGYHRQQRAYDQQQRQRMWRDLPQPAASEVLVGVMGLGVLGTHAAAMLHRMGFQVGGWSRNRKNIPGVQTFSGPVGLDAFLRRTEILVCLLPLTPATKEILRLDLFRKLKYNGVMHGAYLINASRGALQIDADIVAALDEGTLLGATVDVFPSEPLPIASPLWSHPKLTITPHVAATATPRTVVSNVVRQIDRHEFGIPLEHLVDRRIGY